MRVFEQSLLIAKSVPEVFEFFSVASNLNTLTPPWVRFEILTPEPIEMGVGTLIDYRIRLRGIPMVWKSRITVWEPNVRFVDEQLSGPYKTWIHTHSFQAAEGGTLMTDRVEYVIPGGLLEPLLFPLVSCDIAKIFAHRSLVLAEKFGSA